ncbi:MULTISPECIES: preprotein translocase subunit SecE [Coprobacillaceae]|uniref:preprotein translocase subunit SecE n=1 Tax=Coprobacillaceae TaxID=2810280 RepID=UPI001F316DF7|nr:MULTISPECIES: preprotein translocase subunit SecE [Coprobacillaceae]
MFKKTDSKEMEIHETSDFKLKDWCQLKGIRAEIKNVSWLSKKELAKNSAVVLLFTFVMGLFFFGGDAVIAFILKALGMN